jgi:hypothetical protein
VLIFYEYRRRKILRDAERIFTEYVFTPASSVPDKGSRVFPVAFALPSDYKAGAGFSIVGAHTDSPCYKIRPVSKSEKLGYIGTSVET